MGGGGLAWENVRRQLASCAGDTFVYCPRSKLISDFRTRGRSSFLQNGALSRRDDDGVFWWKLRGKVYFFSSSSSSRNVVFWFWDLWRVWNYWMNFEMRGDTCLSTSRPVWWQSERRIFRVGSNEQILKLRLTNGTVKMDSSRGRERERRRSEVQCTLASRTNRFPRVWRNNWLKSLINRRGNDNLRRGVHRLDKEKRLHKIYTRIAKIVPRGQPINSDYQQCC